MLNNAGYRTIPLLSKCSEFPNCCFGVELAFAEDVGQVLADRGHPRLVQLGQLVGVVENARLIDAIEHGEAGTKYLQEVRSWHTLGQMGPRETAPDLELSGTPASPGIAVGVALFRGSHDLAYNTHSLPFLGVEAERARVETAFAGTRRDILKIQEAAEREAGEEHALIFSSHLLLLNDPVLMERILSAVKDGDNAAAAIYDAFEHFSDKLKNVPDPYIQDRVEDMRDLRSRLLDQLLRTSAPQSSTMSDKIVIARGIPPSLVVELKAVERLAPIHIAQILSYLKAAKLQHSLLITFNVLSLRLGIKRVIQSS